MIDPSSLKGVRGGGIIGPSKLKGTVGKIINNTIVVFC